MAATQGTAIFLGLQTGQTYIKDIYLSDTAGTKVNWDDGGGASATTSEKWTPPEDVALVDLAIVTGGAQTRLQLIQGGNPTGNICAHVVQVDTSAGRPRLNVPFTAGVEISIIQLA